LNTSLIKLFETPDKFWEHYSIPAFDENEFPASELGSEIKSNKYKVHSSAILSSKLNPHFPRTWWPDIESEDTAICSTEFMEFVPLEVQARGFVYGLITSKPFQDGIAQRVTGTTGSRQRAQPKSVGEIPTVRPDDELVLVFSRLCETIMKKKAKKYSTKSDARESKRWATAKTPLRRNHPR
jgi:type I restriction enzyme S subunit